MNTIIQNKIDCQELITNIYDILQSNMFSWYWNEYQIQGSDSPEKLKDQYAGFTHIFYRDGEINSGYFQMATELLNLILQKENIRLKTIVRMQANLLTNINVSDEQLLNSIHQDLKLDNCISVVYYVMDSDGDTYIYQEDTEIRVPPKQGSYVIFKSSLNHRASVPSLHKRRMVINCIVEI